MSKQIKISVKAAPNLDTGVRDISFMNPNYKERFEQLVNYYNYDKGVELPDDLSDTRRIPYRAVCAMLAWCMVDKDKFNEMYSKSKDWQRYCITTLRAYYAKNFFMGVSDKEFIDTVRDYLHLNFSKKFVWSPSEGESGLDLETVHNILYEGAAGNAN